MKQTKQAPPRRVIPPNKAPVGRDASDYDLGTWEPRNRADVILDVSSVCNDLAEGVSNIRGQS